MATPDRGPAAFFSTHPLAYSLSMAAAATTAVYAEQRARHEHKKAKRLAFHLLALETAVQFFGMFIGTERYRHNHPVAAL